MARKYPTGEFRLIDDIRRQLSKAPVNSGILIGIGDDAAVVKTSGSRKLVLTVDTLIEGIHFDPLYADYESVGWKALAVNVSDLVAMGATPKWALVQLTITPRTTSKQVRSLYRGLRKASTVFDCTIAGGNTSHSTKEFSVGITAVGVAGGSILTRAGAKKADVIAVTGNLGASAAGQKLMAKTRKKVAGYPAAKHLRPMARLYEMNRLKKAGVRMNACIDISDGLSSELNHLAKSSRCGMAVDLRTLPIHPSTRQIAGRLGLDPIGLALHGGEEYELILTMSPGQFLKARKILGKKITGIGTVTSKKGVFGLDDDGLKPIAANGYIHF